MADYVNLQQDECDTTALNLNLVHTQLQEGVREIAKEIQQLADVDGGFYVEKISQKIQDILTGLEEDILLCLQENFENSENGMAEFMRNVIQIDQVD